MLYLWEMPERPQKFTADYRRELSPNSSLLMKGASLSPNKFGRCYVYSRSFLVDLADDFFIRTVVRHNSQSAYIFTQEEMFCFTGSIAIKVNISVENLKKIKEALSLTDEDIDKEPKILSDAHLEIIHAIIGRSLFSRTPIFNLGASTAIIQKNYDCIPTNAGSPLVNQKIVDLLLKLIPNEVQFFDAEVHCKDGILSNYKLLNVTHTIVGIDREKSIYRKMENAPDFILGFKYLTYKPGCMGKNKLARDKEYLCNILVTEEIKQVFEREKIKGIWFVTPEEWSTLVSGGFC